MGHGRHSIHHAAAAAELGVETASAVDLWAGILNGVTSFVAAFASPVLGRVADRRGRKLMLLRSSLAIGGFTALMGVAANVWQFFAFRALMGVFAGFSSAAIALVASQVPEGRLGYALGWLQHRPVAPPKARGRRSILSSLIAVASTPVLLALFFVLMMAQFGVRTVQPIVTLYVQEMVGPAPTWPP